MRYRHLLWLLALAYVVPTWGRDSDVSGTVRDSAGNPLADISVVGLHHFPAGGIDEHRTKTDRRGHFELKNVGRVFFFVAPKFQGVTYTRKPEEPSFEISLTPDLEDHWPVTCPGGKEAGKRYGSIFWFLVPSDAKTKFHRGDDTWNLVISMPRTKTNEHLVLWSGPMLGDGFVPEKRILEASSFTQTGFDWRGKDHRGRRWRWFSSIQDLMHYEDASDEAARFFDGIIDSVCVRRLPDGTTNTHN